MPVVLFVIAGAADAAEPLPPTRQAAAAWYQAEAPILDRILEPLRADLWALQLEPDAGRAETRRVALCDRARGAGPAIAAILPFDPDDRVRAAARAEVEGLAAACEEGLRAWVKLRDPLVADEDLAAAVSAADEAGLLAATVATDAAAVTFGEAWGLQVNRPDRARRGFESPSLAPEGSEAPARMVVQLAIAYDGQLQPIVEGADEAWRTWAEALARWDPTAKDALTGSRAKLGRARQALDRVEPWLGDPALRDAAVAHVDALAKAMDGLGAQATAIAAAGLHAASEQEAQKPRLQALDAELVAARAKWEAARRAFADRWAVPQYRAWLPR